jgi:hypothetical protein
MLLNRLFIIYMLLDYLNLNSLVSIELIETNQKQLILNTELIIMI